MDAINEKRIGELTADFSHAIRTPMTSIQGFAELLLNDKTISGESREFLQIIVDESRRMVKMLKEFQANIDGIA